MASSSTGGQQYELVFDWRPNSQLWNQMANICKPQCYLISPIKWRGRDKRPSLPFLRNFAYKKSNNQLEDRPVLTNNPCDKLYGVIIAIPQHHVSTLQNIVKIPFSAVETFGETITNIINIINKELSGSTFNIDFINIIDFQINNSTNNKHKCNSDDIAILIEGIVNNLDQKGIGKPRDAEIMRRDEIKELMYSDPTCYS